MVKNRRQLANHTVSQEVSTSFVTEIGNQRGQALNPDSATHSGIGTSYLNSLAPTLLPQRLGLLGLDEIQLSTEHQVRVQPPLPWYSVL